jgi:hypothetical protein
MTRVVSAINGGGLTVMAEKAAMRQFHHHFAITLNPFPSRLRALLTPSSARPRIFLMSHPFLPSGVPS